MARTRPNSLEREEDGEGANEGAVQDSTFTKDGRPVYFYLYGTNEPRTAGALTEGQREEMTRLITEHGGLVCQSAADSDTIIVATAGLEDLKKKYDLERDRYVEPPAFVRLCISQGVYAHQPVARLPLGGVAPGRSRTPFTTEDDMNLCRFIALHMPEKAAGGRFGMKPYAELAEKAQYGDLDYQWVKRHTVQSWRERYKQGWRRLDPLIDALVEENPPPKDGKGVRPYDRRVNNKALFFEAQVQENEDGENEFDRDDEELAAEQDLEGDQPVKSLANAQSAGQRARHTDLGPRRVPPLAGEPSRRTRSMPGVKRRVDPEQDDDDGGGEFDLNPPGIEQYPEFDYRPGPEEAGPSRTQRTPSPPTDSSQQAAQAPQPARLVKRELRAAARRVQQREPQVPMSSQATLVGPVPTQLRGAATAAKLPPSQRANPTRDSDAAPAPAEQRASKRRKIHAAPMLPPVVSLEPLRRAGVGSRSALQTAWKTAPRPINRHQAGPSSVPVAAPSPPPAAMEEEVEEEDKENDIEVEDAPQRDEQDVEALLQAASAERSREFSPEAAEPSEDLDTDDQVSRDKLLRYAPRDREVEDDDDEAFAASLDLISASRSRSVAVPDVLFPPAGWAHVTPLKRTNTNASRASSASNVPLPGTRASEKKREARESEKHIPYVPPSETRAAMVLRNRNVIRR